MTDIVKCAQNHCPSRMHCYRFTAPADAHWQYYGLFMPEPGQQACDFYLNAELRAKRTAHPGR